MSRVEREYAWSGVIRPPFAVPCSVNLSLSLRLSMSEGEHSLESLCTVVHDNEDDVLTYQRRSNAEPQVQEEVTLKRKWTKSDKEVRNKVILKGRDNFKLGVFLVGFFFFVADSLNVLNTEHSLHSHTLFLSLWYLCRYTFVPACCIYLHCEGISTGYCCIKLNTACALNGTEYQGLIVALFCQNLHLIVIQPTT